MDAFRTPASTRSPGSLHVRRRLATLLLALALAACTAGPGATIAPAAPTRAITASPTLAPTPTPTPTATPIPTPVVPTTPKPTPSSSAIATPVAVSYPLSLKDDENREVVLKAEPHKIVSLTPATTELVFALGAGDRLVGGTDFDDFPPEAVPLADVANFSSVDVEQILSLGADLVIAGGNGFNPPAALEQLRRLGVPVLVVYAATVDAVLADIELVGLAINRADEAKALTAQMRLGIEDVQAAVRDEPRPRTFYELDATNEIFGPADKSFIAEMVDLAGGDPITTGSETVFSIPLERLVAADPEVIVLGDAAYGTTPEAVAARPGWRTMTAVKTKAIRPVNDTLVTRPGPRLIEGLRALALAIHPDLVLPPPAVAVTEAAPARPRAEGRPAAPARRARPWPVGLRRAALGVGALLLLALVLGVGLGTVTVAPDQIVGILARRVLGLGVDVTWTPAAEAIVMDLRLPRVLSAMAVGLGLSVAGATFQGLLRNPLANPYVLGTASGAALGAAIAVLIPVRALIFEFGLLHVLAFAGALTAVWVVYRLSRPSGPAPMTSLLLTGYAIGSLLAAGLAMAMYLAGSNLRQIFFYLLGSLDGSTWVRLAVAGPLILVASGLILLRARALNGFLLGEEAAAHLGVDVRRERAILLALASLVTAAAVTISGLIGFVGLVVPHVVRLAVGPNARLVLPLSALGGAALLTLADLGARMAGEVPVGVVTALLGAPFFLSLLRRVRSGYEL